MSASQSTEPIRYDYTNVLTDRIGPQEGISRQELEGLAGEVARHHAGIVNDRRAGKLAWMDLPGRSDYAEQALKLAADRRREFENFVLLGIGGSALGAIALHTALSHPFYNLLPATRRPGPRLFVADNIDPVFMHALLETLEPRKTLFNVVTKSGETAETMSQLMIVARLLRDRLGKRKLADHLIATTDVGKGALRQIVKAEGLESVVAPEGVGGRYSVLSPVGLLPAAMVGIDIKRLLAGAAAMDRRCQTDQLAQNPAYTAAAVHFVMETRKRKNVAVMMSYSHQLRDVADWFRQLWAESLGKEKTVGGRAEHTGQTPVKALGVTDQHSQVQLYMQGPADKMFTFLAVDKFTEDIAIPEEFKEQDACGYLSGRTLGELFEAERKGTQMALTDVRRPNATIYLPTVNPHSVGQLLFMLEVQTAMTGRLLGVNAFDQPGVEAGKKAAYALMGRKGYEDHRKEIESKTGSVVPRVV